MEILEESEKVRENAIQRLAFSERAKDIKASQPIFPEAKEYPVSFRNFLEILMPNKRPRVRESFYRKYLLDTVKLGKEETNATPEHVDRQIAHEKKNGFDRVRYFLWGPSFLYWLEENAARLRAEKAQNAAAKKWKTKYKPNG